MSVLSRLQKNDLWRLYSPLITPVDFLFTLFLSMFFHFASNRPTREKSILERPKGQLKLK